MSVQQLRISVHFRSDAGASPAAEADPGTEPNEKQVLNVVIGHDISLESLLRRGGVGDGVDARLARNLVHWPGPGRIYLKLSTNVLRRYATP